MTNETTITEADLRLAEEIAEFDGIRVPINLAFMIARHRQKYEDELKRRMALLLPRGDRERRLVAVLRECVEVWGNRDAFLLSEERAALQKARAELENCAEIERLLPDP